MKKILILVFVCLVCCYLCWGQDSTTAKWKPCTPVLGMLLFVLGTGLNDSKMETLHS